MKPLKEYIKNDETLIWSHQKGKNIVEYDGVAVSVGITLLGFGIFIIFVGISVQQLLDAMIFIILLFYNINDANYFIIFNLFHRIQLE